MSVSCRCRINIWNLYLETVSTLLMRVKSFKSNPNRTVNECVRLLYISLNLWLIALRLRTKLLYVEEARHNLPCYSLYILPRIDLKVFIRLDHACGSACESLLENLSLLKQYEVRGLIPGRSAAARLLVLRGFQSIRGAWMYVFCECCVLPGIGLWDVPIPCPEESDRVLCVCLWSWNLNNEAA